MRRLSPAMLTMIMLGVVGLLVAMYFVKNMLAEEEVPDPDPIQNIPMALTDLEVGTKITSDHVGVGRARKSSVTKDTVISESVLIGRIVKEPIEAATPILSTSLYPPNEGPPLDLESGTRAVTVNVGGPSSATLRLVKPGQYVDILFTPSNLPNYDESGGLIMTLFKGIKIIAINGITSGGATRGNQRGGEAVTFEATPEQANILLLAADKGRLDVTYTGEGKGTGVVAVDDEHRATLNQILGLAPPPDPETESAFTTELFFGTGRQIRSFVDGKMVDRYEIEQRDYAVDDPANSNRNARPSGNRSNMQNQSSQPSVAAPQRSAGQDSQPEQAGGQRSY